MTAAQESRYNCPREKTGTSIKKSTMPKLATWIRRKDEKWFTPFFTKHPTIEILNAASAPIALENADALLLSGGADIALEYLRQPVPDPSILEKADLERDKWEFAAVENALARGLPFLGICKGLQVLNVALGGTLRLDIPGHNLPPQKDNDVQPLRSDSSARHRFEKVNSSHHQAIDRLGDSFLVESWCATDDIIEQIRLRDYPFALAVQYHPERGSIYGSLFDDFLTRIG
jgi:putative glutamine amidotransferase